MIVGVALLVVGVGSFVVGFYWSPDSRCRMWSNIATICTVYVGLVLAFSSRLL
jgi:hypothetical protein